ncbi:MAG: glycosyltransferase family 4 protein [bacterium]
MKKILYINHISKVSGGERSLLEVIKRINRNKYLPIILCPEEGRLTDLCRKHGLEYRLLKLPKMWVTYNLIVVTRFFFSTILVSLQLHNLIKKEKIDLIHANTSIAGIYSILACPALPIIIHVRDIYRKTFFRKFIIWFLSRFSSRIVVVSQAVAQLFPKGDKKIKLVYNGIDVEDFSSNLRGGVLKTDYKDKFLIGYLGQITARKGIDIFIESAGLINNKSKGTAIFFILGEIFHDEDIKYKKLLENLIEGYRLQETVVFLGHKDDPREYLLDFDIIVVPSNTPDPLPRIILEAMALEKAVIGTNLGGIPEQIIDNLNGLLIEPNNALALAKAIGCLLNNPTKLKKMGTEGKKRVKICFDINRSVKRIEDIYQELL